jgi:hypothetical protein
MTSQTRLFAGLLAGAAVLAMVVAWLVTAGNRSEATGWPPSERAAFMRNCVEQCRKSPGVTEEKYPLCDRACTCSADEGEKIMTASELEGIAQAISKGIASVEQTAKMNRLKAAGMSCAAASSPVGK